MDPNKNQNEEEYSEPVWLGVVIYAVCGFLGFLLITRTPFPINIGGFFFAGMVLFGAGFETIEWRKKRKNK